MVLNYVGKCLVIEENEKTLVFGDMHFGYEYELNEAGIMILKQMFDELLSDIKKVFKLAGKIDRVVFLGDIKHGFSGINRQEWGDLMRLFNFIYENCSEIVLIKGNHDNYLKNVVEKWREERGGGFEIDVYDYYTLGKYCFLHGDRDFDEIYDKKIKYWIVGHAHPAVVLKEGAKKEKYKCFLAGSFKGKKVIIVPSFAEFVEGSDPREHKFKLAWDFDIMNFEVSIVENEKSVLNFGKLKNLN